jgi:hypothetical protein
MRLHGAASHNSHFQRVTEPLPSHINPLHIPTPYLLNFRFNNALSSRPKYLKHFLPFRISDQSRVFIYQIYAFYMATTSSGLQVLHSIPSQKGHERLSASQKRFSTCRWLTVKISGNYIQGQSSPTAHL